MKFLLIAVLPLFLFAAQAFADAPPAACPVINGHFVDDLGTNDFSLHTKQDGAVFSYAFGEAPLSYFPATGQETPVNSPGDTGSVKMECGAGYMMATEKSLRDGTSTIRITPTGAETFRMEGTGLYSVGTGNYHRDQ